MKLPHYLDQFFSDPEVVLLSEFYRIYYSTIIPNGKGSKLENKWYIYHLDVQVQLY